MNCYRTSNNKYFTVPPRMADGRHFTEYRENTKVNELLGLDSNTKNSYEYRQFLINNGEKIMDLNNKQAFLLNGVSECKQPFGSGTMLPEKEKQVCNLKSCEVVLNDPNGIGLGRSYSTQPNPCLNGFSSAPMQLQANECASQLDLGNYFPAMKVEDDLRPAVPGGGQMLSGGDPNQA